MSFDAGFSELEDVVSYLAQEVSSFVNGAKKARETVKKIRRKILCVIQSEPSGEAPFEPDETHPETNIDDIDAVKEEDIPEALKSCPGISEKLLKKRQEMLNIRKQQARLHMDLSNIMQQINDQETLGMIRPDQIRTLKSSCKDISSNLGTLARLVGAEVTQKSRADEISKLVEKLNSRPHDRDNSDDMGMKPPPPPNFKFE